MLPSIRKCARGDSKLTEAVGFLNGPNFIPAESRPAEVEFTSKIHFAFPSPRPCEYPQNNIVHGRFYRHAKDWQKFPTIILLHGGSDFLSQRYGFPLKVPAIHRAGFNAATLVAPYHFQRRVRRIETFDHLRVAEAFAQAVAEIRAFTGWLLDQGSASVALFGFSLGGWLAGLAAARDSRLKAVILALPGVRRDYRATRGECVLWTPTRKALEKQKAAREALDKTPMNLTLSQPVIPKENILLIQGRYDLLVGAEQTEELWQTWKQPEIWRLPHGHISWMAARGLTGRVLHWLSPRLNAPAVQAGPSDARGIVQNSAQ
jgi:dienelactone hydrolase